ncbi:M15 family metallopeptidase [Nocardioides jensenii]|uniref:M15 family metallopeptidase n=1 Tax=Nocardioides jensenii TaxID=1843 RepID=UPI00083386F7|nr:M15 family metallopeptidase [Nocardioides jensenii]
MLVRLAVAALATLVMAAPAASAVPVSASSPDDPEFSASVTTVSEEYRDRMIGVSWEEGCPVPIDDLRIIEMNYWGFDGTVHDGGQLMVHKDVADTVVTVFSEMFDEEFPIRGMQLIEEYDGSDDASMAADNTSSFNCRPITGSPGRFSIHSYGKAIDINTIENPYVKGDLVLPPAGAEFLDRDDVRPGMITKNDPVVKSFKKRGFDWGGSWHSLKDYQHFEAKKS